MQEQVDSEEKGHKQLPSAMCLLSVEDRPLWSFASEPYDVTNIKESSPHS